MQLERSRRYSRDEELSKELLFWMAYQGTPYEHPEEGYVQSVKSITLDDVRSFYRDNYVRDNVVVGVGGGYPEGFPVRVRDRLRPVAARRNGSRAIRHPSLPCLTAMKVLIVEKQTDASAISMGFPIDFSAAMTTSSPCSPPTPGSASTATPSATSTR